ncbi:MAG: hypothetical protein BroJett024_43680 [Alphaproteobacteria bacterium]|nr:MAG: hypothetical protein BroJett024_43680 [Alphaproteobacteria bacterium]
MRRSLFAIAIAAAFIVAGAGTPVAPPAKAQTGASAQAERLPEGTVRALQQALNAQGIAVPVDGVLGPATYAAIRQYQTQHHLPVTGEPDAATLEKLGVVAQRNESPAASLQAGVAGTPDGQRGAPAQARAQSGMMTAQGMMGPGMMGGPDQPGTMGMPAGQMPMMGDSMMMPGGMMMCPMMAGTMGMQPRMMPMAPGGAGMMGPATMGPGMGPGMMVGMGRGQGATGLGFGVVRPSQHLSVDDVRHHFEHRLEWLGNPRLKIGEVTQADENTIVAAIVTVDGSLVDRLSVDRHTGVIQRAR